MDISHLRPNRPSYPLEESKGGFSPAPLLNAPLFRVRKVLLPAVRDPLLLLMDRVQDQEIQDDENDDAIAASAHRWVTNHSRRIGCPGAAV